MTNAFDFGGLAKMRAVAVQSDEKVTKEVAQRKDGPTTETLNRVRYELDTASDILASPTTVLPSLMRISCRMCLDLLR